MRILGHEFRQMTSEDYDGFAGADEGSWICELEDTVLIWSPGSGTLAEIYDEGERQRDWTFMLIL